MNNVELEQFLLNTACAQRYGKGSIRVLACDQLPTDHLLPFGSTVIANLSKSGTTGTHWCLFHRPPRKHSSGIDKTPLIWFDSLGITHPNFYPQFKSFLILYNPLVSNNGQPVQEIQRYSESCGMYCLYVAMKLCEGMGFEKILSEFNVKDLNVNECMVLQYLNESFKTDHFTQYVGCLPRVKS
jgi:hypothetical protein